jgi:hypothetical protein
MVIFFPKPRVNQKGKHSKVQRTIRGGKLSRETEKKMNYEE